MENRSETCRCHRPSSCALLEAAGNLCWKEKPRSPPPRSQSTSTKMPLGGAQTEGSTSPGWSGRREDSLWPPLPTPDSPELYFLKSDGIRYLSPSNAAFKVKNRDFPGDSVVKNPPCNAADTSSSPDLWRSHTPQSNYTRAPLLLRPRSRACKLQLLSLHTATTEACAPRACARQQEKPPPWEHRAPQRRVAPALCN